jgi:glycosyltransferase involved in cell wall biosynthesis
MSNKKSIFYDCTKLVQLMHSTQFTGILRTDVEYLRNFIQKKHAFNVYGIFEATKDDGRNYLLFLSSELIAKISDVFHPRWLINEKNLDQRKINIQKIIDSISFSLTEMRLELGTRLDAKIKKFSKNNSIYVNCSFFSILNPLGHAEQIQYSKLKPFYIIYDLLPLEYPEFFWTDEIPVKHLKIITSMASDNSTLIAISEDVKIKIRNLLNQIGVDCNNISVAQCGVSDIFLINKFNEFEKRFFENKFTIFCTIEPRKNHILLLNVWREMINADIKNIPSLTIIGRRGWHNEDIFRFLDKSPAIKEYVTVLNDLTDDQMVAEIKSSKATLFPSFGEGWGLPIVESLSMGVPVICSDIPVHRECSQGLATYIHPLDGLGWYKEIINKINYSEHDDLIARKNISIFKPITWGDSADLMISKIKNSHL